jgi:DNA-binding beta-propeller fold protein YncE
VRFDRGAGGALSNPSCIADPPDAAGCGVSAQGLDGAASVAVSPDSASVYAASGIDDAIVRLDSAPTRALSNPGCVADPPDTAGCGAMAQGLNGVRNVSVSPDGTSVYAAADLDDSIVRFAREPLAALDTDPPETTITKKPKRRTGKRKAKFKFESDEPGSTFECKLDKKGFKPCGPPFKKKVKRGKHKFKVRAIDPAGNVDSTPAKRKWKVKKKK